MKILKLYVDGLSLLFFAIVFLLGVGMLLSVGLDVMGIINLTPRAMNIYGGILLIDISLMILSLAVGWVLKILLEVKEEN